MSMSGQQTVSVGVIGLGRVSSSHVAAYRSDPQARVTAVCDLDVTTTEDVAGRLEARPYVDYRELIDDPYVDAVVVLLPHELHYPVARAALESGKHVCLEKPMAVSAEQCDRLVEVALQQGRILSVTNNTRYATAYVEASRLLRAQALGRIQLVRVLMAGDETDGYRSSDPRDLWRRQQNGIGALIDSAVHYFYLLEWLLGGLSDVRAITRTVTPGLEVDDYALVSGRLATGGAATIEVDLTAQVPWQERLEIYGSSGSLLIDHLANPPGVMYAGAQDRAGTALEGVPFDPGGWRDASIAGSVRAFVDAVATGRFPADDLRHARNAVRLVERAGASAAAGGASVQV